MNRSVGMTCAHEPAHRTQNLLVDPAVEPQLGPVAKQLDVVDDRHLGHTAAVLSADRTMHPHQKSHYRRVDRTVHQLAQAAAAVGGIVSSESIQKSHSPVACRSDSLRAAEKSSHQGKWKSLPPNDSTIRGVSSTEPVSTRIISSTHGRMLSRHAGKVRASRERSCTTRFSAVPGRAATAARRSGQSRRQMDQAPHFGTGCFAGESRAK